MSDIFDDTLMAAAESFFLLPGSETVTYYPTSGSARQIKAVVFRNPAVQLPGLEGGSLPELALMVSNSSGGIETDELDTGGDKIEVAKRVNERPGRLRIVEILNQDAGLMLLALS